MCVCVCVLGRRFRFSYILYLVYCNVNYASLERFLIRFHVDETWRTSTWPKGNNSIAHLSETRRCTASPDALAARLYPMLGAKAVVMFNLSDSELLQLVWHILAMTPRSFFSRVPQLCMPCPLKTQ